MSDVNGEPAVDLDLLDDCDAAVSTGGLDAVDEQLIAQLAGRARAGGLALTGEGGLLAAVDQAAGRVRPGGRDHRPPRLRRHDPAGRDGGNSRNGHRTKTVLTEVGPVEIDVPRDRDGSFDPKIVKKRQRRLSGVDEMVISLSAKGLTTGEVQAHLAEVYGAQVSRQTHLHDHRQGHRGHGRVAEPAPRPGLSGDLHRRDQREDPRREGRQPAHLRRARGHPRRPPRHPRAVGRRRRRGRQVLAARADRAEEPRRERRADDRLRRAAPGYPTRSPPCGRRRSPRPASCTCCATASATPAGSTGTPSPRRCGRSTPPRPRPPRWNGSWSSARTWGERYPAIVRLWENAWAEFVPFLAFDTEIRKVICTTDEIVNPLRGRAGFVVVGAVFVRSPRQSKIVGPEPGSRWSARSAARTNDLDRGEDRRSVRRRWTWSDPVAKCRVWGCQPCRAALPGEGLESRAPVVAATSTPDLPAPALWVAAEPAAVLPVGRVGCQAAIVTR